MSSSDEDDDDLHDVNFLKQKRHRSKRNFYHVSSDSHSSNDENFDVQKSFKHDRFRKSKKLGSTRKSVHFVLGEVMGATQSNTRKEIVQKQVVKVQKDVWDPHVKQYLEENFGKDENYELLGYVSSSHEEDSLSDSNKPSLQTHSANVISANYSLSSSNDESEVESETYEFEENAKKQKKAIQGERVPLESHVKHQGPQIGQESMLKLYGKGFKLLKQMGYTGGGLGKKGTGIVAPIQSQIRHKKEGLKEQGGKNVYKNNLSHDNDPALSALDDLLNTHRSRRSTFDENQFDNEKRSEIPSHKKTLKKHKVHFRSSDEFIQTASETYKTILKRVSSTLTETNPKNIVKETAYTERLSKRYEKVKKYSHFLKDLHHEECFSQDTSHFRVVDMTGPTTRVINDLSEFQFRVSEATLAPLVSEAQSYSFKSNDTIMAIQTASRVLHSHLCKVESHLLECTRKKVLEEQKLHEAKNILKTCTSEIQELEEKINVLKHILKTLSSFIKSRNCIYLEKLIQVGDLVETSNDIQEKRKIALHKYTSINSIPYKSSTIKEQLNEDNLSNDVLSHGSKLLSRRDEVCLVIEKLFKKLTDILLDLRKQWPSQYNDYNIHFLGTEIAALLLYCIDAFLMHQEPFQKNLTFYFTSLLIQFRDACVPSESKELRVVWHHVISERILNDIKQTLEHFQISAETQETKSLDCVFQWIYAVPLCRVIELLQIHLFSKWLTFLSDWLTCSHVDLEKVYNWYNTWKQWFPESLLNEPLVQSFFISGLELINRYLQTLSDETAKEPLENDATRIPHDMHKNQMNVTHGTQRPVSIQEPISPNVQDSLNSPSCSTTQYTTPNNLGEQSTTPTPSIKRSSEIAETKVATSDSRFVFASRLVEIIEGLAEENGILFVPKPSRMYNGRQIYGFGKLSIYIDSGVIYKYNSHNSSWSSIPLSALLDHPK